MEFGNKFLDALPPDIRGRLAPQVTLVHLLGNQILSPDGGAPAFVYFPTTALVSEYRTLEASQTLEVLVVGRNGSALMDAALGLSNAASSTQVCIAGNSYRISMDKMRESLHFESMLRAKAIELVTHQMRQMTQRLLCNSIHSVEQRLCKWLSTLAGLTERNHLRVTHEQCAKALGVYRPTISIAMQQLGDAGIILQSRSRIEIFDKEKLKELACPCKWDCENSAKAIVRQY